MAMAFAPLGAGVCLWSMAAEPALPAGRWLGGMGLAASLLGSLRLLGLGGQHTPPDQRTSFRSLARPLLVFVAALLATHASLRAAVAGSVPHQTQTLAVLVPLLFVLLVGSFGACARVLGLLEDAARPLLRRHGFWLCAMTGAIYLPRLGSFGLIDPWETHYGEVAREILARDDWISLWWVQDGWFWSKPILNFWLQALSFAGLGVRYGSDQMIAGLVEGRVPQPEWAVRLPTFLLAVLGQYLLYVGVRKHAGRRAAFLGALVLMSTPFWYFLAHQSMADMIYVGPLAAAMGFLLLALGASSTERMRVVELSFGRVLGAQRSIRISFARLLLAALWLVIVPQVLYLASRNLTFQWLDGPVGFRVDAFDRVLSGSPGNCGLPGNSACHEHRGASAAALQPAVAALGWALLGALLLVRRRNEVRVKRLCYLAAWLCAGLSFMGKGAPGLVLVLFTLAAFLGARNRLDELRHADLGGLVLVLAAAVAPWFVQETARHGLPFVERLFIHDMVKRAFDHVHDTNEGHDTSFRYYVWQLGYGLFPWTGVAAVAALSSVGRSFFGGAPSDSSRRQHDLRYFLFLWLLAAFGMFGVTGTKFHHYIFPLVPAVAMLAGLTLAEYSPPQRGGGDERLLPGWRSPSWSIPLAVALLACGLLLAFSGSLSGQVVERRSGAWPWLAAGLVALSVLVLMAAGRLAKRQPSGPQGAEASVAEGCYAVGAAALVGLAGRDLARGFEHEGGGAVRLLQVFTYNYDRPWPKTLDFSPLLSAVTILAVVGCLMLLAQRWRRLVVPALCTLALLTSAWGVNGYLVGVAPHWGQRETIETYYRTRQSADEPLVAYQLNWKGENFYTGNRIATFVSSGKPFKSWVEKQKKQGVQVMFFTTEHSRIRALQRELGKPENFELLTDERLNNKFALARVQW